jgi:predicted transcriptional regulator
MSAPAVVADLQSEPVVVLRNSCTFAEAARALAAGDTGTALVANEPMREITDRDVVAMVAEGVDAATALVYLDLRPPCLVHPDTSVEDAITMMILTGRRGAIVADDQQPLGVIRLVDAIAALVANSTWVGALRLALHIEREP